jgi:hypothetical protein
MDAASYFLEVANAKKPPQWDALPLWQGRNYVYAEHSRDNVWHGAEFMKMLRSNTHKLVCYEQKETPKGFLEGELYDLINNPEETLNQWDNPAYSAVKQEMLNELSKFGRENTG